MSYYKDFFRNYIPLCRNIIFLYLIRFLIAGFLFLYTSSCSLVDLFPEEGINTNPSKENQIIGENEAIYVSFDFNPEKTSAESLFQVKDYKGRISGSVSWIGKKMIFSPDEKMIRGRRYTLDYSGSVLKKQGGEVKSEIIIPFFYMTGTAALPFLTAVAPKEGSVLDRDETVLFRFSKSMDTDAVRKGFGISPETEYISSWSGNFTELTVIPKDKWKNLTPYTFSFSDEIRCCENIPLESGYSFVFYCDSSHDKPELISLYTVLDDISLSWPRVSDDLNTIKYREGIEIKFSLNMEKETVENSFSISPYISGRNFWKDKKTLIFMTDNGWDLYENYTLKITETAKSENDIASDRIYTALFKPDINELLLLSVDGKSEDGFPVSSYSETVFLDIDTGPAQPYIYSFTFNFSEAFPSDAEKEKLQNNINITSLFPPDISSPFPVSFTWIGDKSLTVKYSGFTAYNSTEKISYYYLLTLKGGESGIRNEAGSFFKEDIKQILRTK